jgi:hypothetical protein
LRSDSGDDEVPQARAAGGEAIVMPWLGRRRPPLNNEDDASFRRGLSIIITIIIGVILVIGVLKAAIATAEDAAIGIVAFLVILAYVLFRREVAQSPDDSDAIPDYPHLVVRRAPPFPGYRYRRQSVSPRRRFEIMRRDGFRCQLCGRSRAEDEDLELEVDHIVPVAKGGTNDPENLWTLCWDCNRGKSDRDL